MSSSSASCGVAEATSASSETSRSWCDGVAAWRFRDGRDAMSRGLVGSPIFGPDGSPI